MKKILYTIIFLLTAFHSSAQKKRTRLDFIGECNVFYHLNNSNFEKSNTQVFTAGNSVGFGIGGGFMFKPRKSSFPKARLTLGVRVNPQSVNVSIGDFAHTERFTNTYFYFKFLMGNSFKSNSNTKFDFWIGFQNLNALSYRFTENELVYGEYLDDITNATAKYVEGAYTLNWGTKQELRVLFCPTIQIGIANDHFIPNKNVHLNLEFSFKPPYEQEDIYSNNKGVAQLFDPNGNETHIEKYVDKQLAVGLSLSVDF